MSAFDITDKEFASVQKLIFDCAGIHLQDNKKSLVVGRLMKRLRNFQLNCFGDYMKLLSDQNGSAEKQIAIDLLTTNETYFFREPKHFEFLQRYLSGRRLDGSTLRIWSAACSYGQEPYSIAMVMAEIFGSRKWEVFASDISKRVLETASKGVYSLEQAEKIPRNYLTKFCLKGTGPQDGTLLIDKNLRDKVKFIHTNLNADLPKMGTFDVIFLRNVMIYFDLETKRQLVQRIKQMLKPGGYLLVGHSETLNGFNPGLTMHLPSIYQNP